MLITVALGTTLAPLNSTMIAVALPHIIKEFGTDLASAGWLVTAYLIIMAAIQPVAGKLGDRFGRRRLMMGGLVVFGLASLGAALAPSLPALLFFRLLQAFSGAVTLPNGTALLREVVPAERRGSRFGFVGAAASLAAAAGPPLGGLLVSGIGWRALFYANVPIVLSALLLGWHAIPRKRAKRDSTASRFDLLGSLLLLLVLGGVSGLLTQNRQGMDGPALALGILLLTGTFALFLRHELNHPDPVVQPRLFRLRAFAAANGAIALSNLSMYVILLAIPFLLSNRPGWTSAEIGLVLALLFGLMVVFSPVGGRLADRFGRRRPATTGLLLLFLGLLPLAIIGGAVNLPVLLGGLALAGVGIGLSGAGLQTSAMEAVGPQQSGMAAGVYSTSRYFGSIVGSSVLAGLLGETYNTAAFGVVFLIVALAALSSVILSIALPANPVPDPKGG